VIVTIDIVMWIKCADGKEWCPLESVNLTKVNVNGVYIIWHEGNPASRLTSHRNDNVILDYGRYGQLRVTWASVASLQLGGVERYLTNTWPPLVGEAFPNETPIPVNSPFGQ
jgi:hypothetical protein